MANTPHFSSVTSSSDFSPRTPYSIDQSLFQSPPRNHPELGSFKTEPTPWGTIFYDSSPLGLQSPRRVKSAFRKHSTLEADLKMKRMSPYKHRSSLQSLEVGFAMRLGRASPHNSLTFDDVVEGNDIFQRSLLQLPNELFNKYYITKLASRDCILSRISMTLCEIDALEKMKDFLIESQKQETEQLAVASEELELFMKEAKARNSSVMHDIASRHTVYADECAALTAADKQLSQLLALSHHESTSDDSDTDTRDDVVYEDDEDEKSEDEKDDSQLYDAPTIDQRTQKCKIIGGEHAIDDVLQDPSFLDKHHSYGVLSAYNPQQINDPQLIVMSFTFRDPILPSYYTFPDPVLPSHNPQVPPFITYPQSTDLPFPPALTMSGGSQLTPPATYSHSITYPHSTTSPSQPAQPDLDPFLSSSQSMSQVHMEHLPTTGTLHAFYPNPLVPIHAGEVATGSFCQTNVITGVTTKPAVRQRQMQMPSTPPPPTTSTSPAKAPTLTKEEMKALHSMIKNNICCYMFNEEAVPHTKRVRDNALKAAINMASNALLSYSHPLMVKKLRPWCVDVMWGIWDAF
ncbi:hypothetical protein EDC04DRAFT_2900737 [Pisolithus marmoratus]|nr:hypothetical protein EDC04DRAFT_2900737 [Pisolithus marmoratus]